MFIIDDFRFAAVSMKKDARLASIIVLVISLGLGITLFSFTIMSSLVNKDLPFYNPSSIVAINGGYNGGRVGFNTVDSRDFFELRQEVQSLENIGAYTFENLIVTYKDTTQLYRATYAEWNLFELTHIDALLGRVFRPEDNSRSAEKVAILSFESWKRDFGGREDILNTIIDISATPTRIIGVMPENYAMPNNTQIWIPLHEQWLQPTERASGWVVGGFGRLKDGYSLQDLNKELHQISARYQEMYPYTNGGHGLYYYATSFPASLWVSNDMKGLVYSVYIITLVIFLLACVNVSTLLLSRVNNRRKELAIRIALGAPAGRVASLIICESILLCTIGCALAVLIAGAGLEITENFLRSYLYNNAPPFWLDLTPGLETLIGLPLILCLTLCLVALLPIVKAVRSDCNSELRDGTRGAQGKKGGWIANLLVISQISLSVMALVLAVLMTISNYLNGQKDYGVDIDKTYTATIQLSEASYPDLESVVAYYDDFVRELSVHQNIESVAIVSRLPSDFPVDGSIRQAYEVEGVKYLRDEDRLEGVRVYAQPGSLSALGVKLLEGRFLDSRDDINGARSVVLTQTLADRLWPEGSALGKRMRLGRWSRMQWMTEEHTPWMTVVGVTKDVYNNDPYGLMSNDNGSAYIPLAQRTIWTSHVMEIAVRYRGDGKAAVEAIETVRRAIDKGVAIYNIKSFENRINKNGDMFEAIGDLFVLCGIISLFLAAVSIYGIIANAITQRTHEIGIRRALGATDSSITMFFLKRSLVNLYIALPIGLVLSIYVVQFLSAKINIHSDGIWIGFILVPLIIVTVSIVATLIPTRTAIKLKPSEALRHS